MHARDKTHFMKGYIIKYRGGKVMTVQAMNKTKIVKKRKLKVRRFQSDRVQKVKVKNGWRYCVAKLEKA